MKKQTIADKMAQKSFFSPQVRNSWNVHMKAFRPILEPAFVDDYQAKVHLCAALNHISNRNVPQGIQKLKKVAEFCETDADKTALLFFLGLACEMAGNREVMVEHYAAANAYGHRFYLPYMKVAKYHLETCDYLPAEENYRAAIGCFDGTGLSSQDKLLLGSAYTNLASSLAMMHRYEEAEDALATSRNLYPDAPGRAAVEALLWAVRSEAEKVEDCLNTLKANVPQAWESVAKSTRQILAGTDPVFFEVPLDEEKIAQFWNWFASFGPQLKQLLDRQEYDTGISAVAQQLLATFPFVEETPYVSLGKNEKGYVLELKDLYAVALEAGYRRLLEVCPEEIKEVWQFAQVH